MDDSSNTKIQTGAMTTGPALDPMWKPINAIIDVDQTGGARLDLVVTVTTTSSCLLIDDAAIVRVK